jgi:hypothetical protein
MNCYAVDIFPNLLFCYSLLGLPYWVLWWRITLGSAVQIGSLHCHRPAQSVQVLSCYSGVLNNECVCTYRAVTWFRHSDSLPRHFVSLKHKTSCSATVNALFNTALILFTSKCLLQVLRVTLQPRNRDWLGLHNQLHNFLLTRFKLTQACVAFSDTLNSFVVMNKCRVFIWLNTQLVLGYNSNAKSCKEKWQWLNAFAIKICKILALAYMSTFNNSKTAERIFMKFDTGKFYSNFWTLAYFR